MRFRNKSTRMSAEYLLRILALAILVTNALETVSQQNFDTEI